MSGTSVADGPPTLHEAEHRYLRDAEFHARVHQAVLALRVDLHGRPTGRLTEREVEIATQAAALGLLMSEFDFNPPTATDRSDPR